MDGSPGEFHDHLPLATWQTLGGYPRKRPAQAQAFLEAIRSDHGADSAFYLDLVKRIRRGEPFALERSLAGEWDDAQQSERHRRVWRTDFYHDSKIYLAAMVAKWRRLNRRCPVRRDLAAAFARMLRDDDGIDWRGVYARTNFDFFAHGKTGAVSPEAMAELTTTAAIYARVGANRLDLLDHKDTADPGHQAYSYATSVMSRITDEALMQTGKDGVAGVREMLAAMPRAKRVRPFCRPEAFAAESANRGHEHPDLGSDDDCWTSTFLARMVGAAVHPDEQDTWTEADLAHAMRSCETPPALHAPLLEFLSMMRVVRDKFPTSAQRQTQADELLARFVARFDVGSRPAARVPKKRTPAPPLTPNQQRSLAKRVAKIAVGTGTADRELVNDPVRFDRLLSKLPAPVRTAIKRFRSDYTAETGEGSFRRSRAFQAGRLDALRDELDQFIEKYYARKR